MLQSEGNLLSMSTPMQYVDIDDECNRLQDEGDPGFTRAVMIAELSEAYPDLKLFRDCWGTIRHCSSSVNAKATHLEIENCQKCDGQPMKAWPYVVVGKGGERLYADPPCYFLADPHRDGFGQIPRSGWLELLEKWGLSESVIKQVEKHLRFNPPISYLGVPDETPDASGSGSPG